LVDAKQAEFMLLSAKVSAKSATEEERARWRELRTELAKPALPPQPGQTARAHPRTAARKLRVHYATVAELAITFSDDFGSGGLRFRTHKHIEPGMTMVVHLDVPNMPAVPPLTLEAKVVWSKREGGHYLVGVELVNLPPAEAERLAALLHDKP
jgi:plasmid stabilization system protein ParE